MSGLIFFLYAKLPASWASLIYSVFFGFLGWLCLRWRHHALGQYYDCNVTMGQLDQATDGSSMAACTFAEVFSLRVSMTFAVIAFVLCVGFAIAWIYYMKNPKGKISMRDLVD